jgi:hypothetical protein
LEEIVAAAVKKTENTTGGMHCADHATPSIRKSWYYFAKKRRSLGRHSSLPDQSHGVFFMDLKIFEVQAGCATKLIIPNCFLAIGI